MNLCNPIGIAAVIMYVSGVWYPFQKEIIGNTLGALGTIGIVVSEIYVFLTWRVVNITGKISIHNSITFAFPEFYMGLGIFVMMIVVYFVIDKKIGYLIHLML